jgi:AcrR family transcriptional regulator
MDTKTQLISTAEQLFNRHGFTATGMDRLTQGAGMSSRTLYKHVGSKTALIAAVLTERDKRFFAQIQAASSVDAIFKALENWMKTEDNLGCLFLRAYAETGGDTPEIADAVSAHKAAFWRKIREVVSAEIGGRSDPVLAEQILVLFEGATAAAIYRGAKSVKAARLAAIALVERARP